MTKPRQMVAAYARGLGSLSRKTERVDLANAAGRVLAAGRDRGRKISRRLRDRRVTDTRAARRNWSGRTALSGRHDACGPGAGGTAGRGRGVGDHDGRAGAGGRRRGGDGGARQSRARRIRSGSIKHSVCSAGRRLKAGDNMVARGRRPRAAQSCCRPARAWGRRRLRWRRVADTPRSRSTSVRGWRFSLPAMSWWR